MATDLVNTKQATSNFCRNNGVSLNSECQCCSPLKSEVQYLINEINSMTEIICILKEELKYNGTVKHDQNTNSVCVKNPMVNSSQCGNCAKRESQLKETTDNVSSVKLITEILNKEIKSMKQTTHMASNTNNPWLTVN